MAVTRVHAVEQGSMFERPLAAVEATAVVHHNMLLFLLGMQGE